MKDYAITCNCGHEVRGQDTRVVEAKMWHHAISDHLDMVKGMSADQLAQIMKGWDQQFAAQK
jgi:predicted small metal-binding protein